MNRNIKSYGFTLIELAMVLFILALLLGSFLTPLATSLEQQDREETNNMLEDIRKNLIGYALVNGHLPCPDCIAAAGNCTGGVTINDGIEDGVNGGAGVSPRVAGNFDSCAVLEGNLPWVTLDMPENDAWGNRFVYQVTDDFADDVDGTTDCTNPAVGLSFCLDSARDDGNLNIFEDSTLAASIAQNVPAIVLSVGKNSSDAFAGLSAAEQENQDGDPNFVSSNYIQATGSEFDDLLIWIPPSVLIYEMVRAERLP